MDQVIQVLAVDDPAVGAYLRNPQLMAAFPVPVRFIVQPWEQYYPSMIDAFHGRASYDIVMVAGHLWKRDFVERKYLLPLDKPDTDLLPAIREEMQYNGQTYLSPSFCDGHMVVYRKSMLPKGTAGWPELLTPEAYLEMARALGPQRIAMKAHSSEIFTDALPFLRMYGGEPYAQDGTPTCDDGDVVRGLTQYCALKGCAMPGTENFGNHEVAEALRQKKCAMGITWSGQLGAVTAVGCLEPEDLGYATLSTAWNVTWSFAVSAASAHAEQAKQLLQYLCAPQADRAVGAVSGAPVRRSSYREGESRYRWYACQQRMIESAKPLPDLSNAGARNGVLYGEIAKAFAGQKTAGEAMRDAKEQILAMG